MSSSPEDPDQSFGDNDYGNTPTHNRPWPKAGPLFQARFERQYFVPGQTINFENLPRMQSWSSWFGMSDAFYILTVLNRVATHATSAQRPMTGLEANALGEHTVHALRWMAWAQPVAISIAAAMTMNSWRTFKFPLIRPRKNFSPYYFPTRRIPFLKGPRAAAMWHTLRFGAYLPLVWVPTFFIFISIGQTSFQAHMMRDPRLDGLLADIRRAQGLPAGRRGIEKQPGRQTGSAPQFPRPGNNGAYEDTSTPREHGSIEYPIDPNTAFGRPSTPPEASRTTRPNWTQSTSTQSTGRGTRENSLPGVGSRHRDDDPDFLDDNDDDDDDDDDDASPVASSARRADASKGMSGSSGSSWDRIRRQAKSGDPNWDAGDSSGQERGWAQLRQDKTRNPKDSNPRTDSYTYSSGDEERERRNYEKEQAQKEFDALVDAERQGDNSSGSSDKSRGWRR